MKTPEDEAFDELARKQGAWGGGFKAKQAMAADKLQECPNLKNCEGACFQCAYFNAETGKTEYPVAQPAQEPPSMKEELTKIMTDSYDQGVKDALETIVQLIKELRPAIRASEVMGKGKPTEEWFDILAGAIKEKNT